MHESSELDPLAVRRQFARRGGRLADADFLFREVERQMLERLALIRIEPERVLDVGCGLGNGLLALRRRYPQAQAFGLDSALPVLAGAASQLTVAPTSMFARMMRQIQRAGPRRLASLIAADAARVPFADNTIDLIWSNLCLHWVTDIEAAIAEWHRVIRPDGLVMFTLFGVDTLAELRNGGARLMRFGDMHDIGDALVGAGFADPVMDMHQLKLTFDDPARLLADLHALGGNALADRARGLRGTASRRAWLTQLLHQRDTDGKLHVTFEICHGHAWCPSQKRLPRGLARVQFQPKPGGGG